MGGGPNESTNFNVPSAVRVNSSIITSKSFAALGARSLGSFSHILLV